MSQDTKRKMSVNGFLSAINKAASKSTALGFFAQYREYMVSGELAFLLSPIVRKVDEGQLMPTNALEQLGNIVLTHILASHLVKAEQSLEAQLNGEPSKSENWTATIYNSKDEIQSYINNKGKEVELQKSFTLSGDADKYADRFLTIDSSGSDWYCRITHTHSKVETIVLRQDALARVFKAKKHPFSTSPKTSGQSLGWKMKVKNDRASFSKG